MGLNTSADYAPNNNDVEDDELEEETLSSVAPLEKIPRIPLPQGNNESSEKGDTMQVWS